MKKIIFTLMISGIIFLALPLQHANAGCCPPTCSGCGCAAYINGPACSQGCGTISTEETGTSDKPTTTIGHITDEFRKHRIWMVEAFFKDPKAGDKIGLLAAMKLMTEQLVASGMQQVQIIGSFFDAKHQLETQRLFQQLTAQAHKDYHPSEGLCEFGTITRSLAPSNRNIDLTAQAYAKRSVERQVLNKNSISAQGTLSDQKSRLAQFIKNYCNPLDNSGNLDLLCQKGSAKTEMKNKDVNYTALIEAPLTLDVDFSENGQDQTEDEDALFALSANLFANTTMPTVPAISLIDRKTGEPDYGGSAKHYQDSRALAAKRSVAVNSLAAITGLKAKGSPESQPFIYALLKEMGGDDMDVETIKELLGERPSYNAQMKVLTQYLYQQPNFYADLYDKPANVLRKDVAMQAAELMQKRDIYRSLLRAEVILATMLETAIEQHQQKVTNEFNRAREGQQVNLGNGGS